MTTKTKLTPRQIQALHLILEGWPLKEIAEKLQISRQTLSEWKNQNALFKAKLEELRAEAEDDLHFSLQATFAVAFSQLRMLMVGGSEKVKISALGIFFNKFASKDETKPQGSSSILSEEGKIILKTMQKAQKDEEQEDGEQGKEEDE